MTTETTLAEAEEAAAKAAGERLAKTGIALLATLAFVALFSWLGGIALNKGFGVHLPFIAGVILLGVGLSVVKMAAGEVASVWHSARVKADINLIAATMAAQQEIQAQQSTGDLADFLAKLDPENTDNSGAYL